MVDQLIYKYLKGNINLEEQHELSKWMAGDSKNREVLKRLEIYWNEYDSNLKEEELAVRRMILSRMAADTNRPAKGNRSITRYLLRVAAIVVLSLSIGLVLSQYMKKEEQPPEITWVEKESKPGQKITTILPDGTRVKLNTDSKLISPTSFTGDFRKVILKGEAFFEVTRNESKPFIIETENMEIMVLGTSFIVSAYENETINSVSVKSGKVEVKGTYAMAPIQLTQNEATFYQGEAEMKKSEIIKPDYVFGWIDQKLLFDNHSIEEVLDRISRWYGVEIDLKKRLEQQKRYTASFENPTLKQVMDILAFVYDFDYEINGNELIIK
ncbi:MAG: DUF4974 domain-containing protein [Cyclobacteriaceae bacterium]|nr:DUF4974 domain-containing protein [Cyclobacteriaceae bacterium SS2]